MTNTPDTDTDWLEDLIIQIMQGGFESAMGGTPFMSPDEVIALNKQTYQNTIDEAKAAIVKKLNAARIDELQKVLKHCPMPTLSYEDIKDRIKALQASKEGK